MIPKEVIKKVKLIEIQTRKMVNNVFAGEYHTHFKGQGMTFSDFREYVPGDDIRTISWPLTARTGKTFIKTFEEERELTIILAVDVSGSTDFGTGLNFKGEIIIYLSALLAYAAERNKDQVGLVLFSDHVEHFIPPKKGRGHLQRMLRDLLYFKPKHNKTKISSCAQFLQGFLKKRATIFLMSDFLDQDYDQSLRFLAKKHEVVACVIEDPAEKNIPDLGLIELQDPETGEILLVDTASTEFQEKVRKANFYSSEQKEKNLKKAQIAKVAISTHDDYVQPLLEFFKRKKR
ncbi:MAG: DUF58 domain-containing protein [Bdellovibrionaceae bacterium]|nr:DUF58 domain-containing protein [Pseudobdellovibrionaceae bacterium]